MAVEVDIGCWEDIPVAVVTDIGCWEYHDTYQLQDTSLVFNLESTAVNFRFGAVQVFTPQPSGGGVASGTAGKARARAYGIAVGGGTAGGVASTLYAPSGGIRGVYEGSGGGNASGEATMVRTRVWLPTGGASASGTATRGHIWVRTGGGGAAATGAATTLGPISAWRFNFVATSGADNFRFSGGTPANVFIRPISDVTAGFWLTNSGYPTGLAATLSEISPDDSSFIRSDVSPTNSKVRVRLAAPLATPDIKTGHRYHFRYAKHGEGTIHLTARLWQATTLIWSKVYYAVSTDVVEADEALSEAEATTITDYSLLDLEWETSLVQPPPITPYLYSPTGGAAASGTALIGRTWARIGVGGAVPGTLVATHSRTRARIGSGGSSAGGAGTTSLVPFVSPTGYNLVTSFSLTQNNPFTYLTRLENDTSETLMTADSPNNRYTYSGDTAALIMANGTQSPGLSRKTVRRLTIPADGLVAIDGSVARLAAGGDGTFVRIMHRSPICDTILAAWAPLTYTDGTQTFHEELNCLAGDTLHFEAASGGVSTANDTIAWTGTISTVGGPAPTSFDIGCWEYH